MDDLRRIDLNLLLTLHALLSEQHVSRAAVRLHRSQPAVSHALAQLRDIFADPLLVRRGGRLHLSSRAQALREPLEQALAQLDGLLGSPRFEPNRARRTFRLAMSDYGARVVLPGLMRKLREQAPGIDLVVSQGSREAMIGQLIDGEVDLALGVFPDLPSEVEVQVLFEESFICLADRHSLPARTGLSLAQWLARPHVLVAVRPGIDNEIDLALQASGQGRRIALTLPHWGVAQGVISGTDLILTVARRSLAGTRLDPGLRCFAPPLPIAPFAFTQAWHTRREGDAGHRWLRELIRTLCDEHDVPSLAS
ncbi:Nodulation protein D 2 [Pseudomonas putida]|uniref:LysR family transcriptional regulator n=1 Tax=Pseudomonas TaxID=286 RepID=UPI0018D8932F|nr:LysR family transcriptional regulator [Pseudomonas guariconensis]CAB5526107.1 Nodulation protein D 2 [Pseudomonas putida]MBH3359141.1 LysR family transcriptional regulator [Pseudomonas guariconensis]MCO7620405.1 LysR family transcriptional regulator [Pseudomonas guariconensis]MEB3839914.1 LysR family transcriptional regulator [Pseudomonas guariconensis]MEB3872782.1 LysR family transcriptional regulator [Pseudomonas guariconensis]